MTAKNREYNVTSMCIDALEHGTQPDSARSHAEHVRSALLERDAEIDRLKQRLRAQEELTAKMRRGAVSSVSALQKQIEDLKKRLGSTQNALSLLRQSGKSTKRTAGRKRPVPPPVPDVPPVPPVSDVEDAVTSTASRLGGWLRGVADAIDGNK